MQKDRINSEGLYGSYQETNTGSTEGKTCKLSELSKAAWGGEWRWAVNALRLEIMKLPQKASHWSAPQLPSDSKTPLSTALQVVLLGLQASAYDMKWSVWRSLPSMGITQEAGTGSPSTWGFGAYHRSWNTANPP